MDNINRYSIHNSNNLQEFISSHCKHISSSNNNNSHKQCIISNLLILALCNMGLQHGKVQLAVMFNH